MLLLFFVRSVSPGQHWLLFPVSTSLTTQLMMFALKVSKLARSMFFYYYCQTEFSSYHLAIGNMVVCDDTNLRIVHLHHNKLGEKGATALSRGYVHYGYSLILSASQNQVARSRIWTCLLMILGTRVASTLLFLCPPMDPSKILSCPTPRLVLKVRGYWIFWLF